MSSSSSLSSSVSSSSKQRSSRSSAWRKGSVGSGRRSSAEGGTHTTETSMSSYSLQPISKMIRSRRSSTGDTASVATGSSSRSADNLLSSKPSTSTYHIDESDELKNQIEENLYLTQEVLDLKMRLANAMAQIDAEKHTNRLQAEQISHLCDDNDELKCFLDQAYERISELEAGKVSGARSDRDRVVANLGESVASPSASRRPNEGWLHRVASTMNMSSSTFNSSPSTNLSADNQEHARKQTASPANTVSTQQSSMTLMERSSRRLSMLTLGSSLADEELPVSYLERRSSMLERRSSVYSSLSTFHEENGVSGSCDFQHKEMNSTDEEDDWLDGGVVLPEDIAQLTFTARNA